MIEIPGVKKIFHPFAAHIGGQKQFLALQEKFRISGQPCDILHMFE